MISVSHISKSFGTHRAISDISFEIDNHEIVGLLGPNGAGKTTTMRILTGFLSQDKGTVTINKINITEDPQKAQKQIGYLPENNPLYKDMLVSEFLNFSAKLKNIEKSKRSDAFEFVADAVDIADVFYRPIGELSKGYKQRVGLAAAILNQPPIIIMDEPSEGLDPNQRTDMRSLIKKLAKKHTILVSTHVMQEAQAICDRLLIMNTGQLIADGTVDQLMRKGKASKELLVDIEGEGVLEKIESEKELKVSDVKKHGKRLTAKISTKGKIELPPLISKLAHDNNWIIWKLVQNENRLEDIFHDLTIED